MSFLTLKQEIEEDLNDSGISYSDSELTESLQDAYNDIACLTGCIIKRETAVPFVAVQSYIDLSSIVSDFCSCRAIYNNSNNRWLQDDIDLRKFRQFGDNWELHTGTPQNWAPSADGKRVALYKKYATVTASETYDLIYSATAPTVTDITNPLVAADMIKLFNFYVKPDLLESYGEFSAAMEYWKLYYPLIQAYKERVKNIANADLITLI